VHIIVRLQGAVLLVSMLLQVDAELEKALRRKKCIGDEETMDSAAGVTGARQKGRIQEILKILFFIWHLLEGRNGIEV
jgi:hypothetical protein